MRGKKDILSNKLFFLTILAILPTMILGFFKIESKVLVWVFDALTIIISFLIFFFTKFKLKKEDLKYIIFFLFFLIVQLLSYILPGYIEIKTLYMSLPILYFIHFIYTKMGVNSIDENTDIENYMKKFLLLVIFSCMYNLIVNYKLIFNIANISSRYINISSFFSQRNAFGQLLYLGVISNIYIIKKYPKNKFYIFSLILILLNLLFSFSRTAIFSTCIFLTFAYFKINLKKIKKNKILFGIFIFVIVFLAGLSIINSEKAIYFLNYYVFRSDDGLTGRDVLWIKALSLLKSYRLIFGYGLGSSSVILEVYNLTNTHNTYIELLLVGGIFMFILYTSIYINTYKTINKINDDNERKLFKAMFISMIVYSFFEKVLIFSTGYAAYYFTLFLIILPQLSKKVNIKK